MKQTFTAEAATASKAPSRSNASAASYIRQPPDEKWHKKEGNRYHTAIVQHRLSSWECEDNRRDYERHGRCEGYGTFAQSKESEVPTPTTLPNTKLYCLYYYTVSKKRINYLVLLL